MRQGIVSDGVRIGFTAFPALSPGPAGLTGEGRAHKLQRVRSWTFAPSQPQVTPLAAAVNPPICG